MRKAEITNLTAPQVLLDVEHISGAVVNYIGLGTFDIKINVFKSVLIGSKIKVMY